MDLHLESDERELLQRILATYLSDLRMEIGHTEEYELRQDMKRDEARAREILARLQHAVLPSS